jgi:hypothetical protein
VTADIGYRGFLGVVVWFANGQVIAGGPPSRRQKILPITPGFVNLNYRKEGKTIERDSVLRRRGCGP